MPVDTTETTYPKSAPGYTPQSFQSMVGLTYMLTFLFQTIENAQLRKQEDENRSDGSISMKK